MAFDATIVKKRLAQFWVACKEKRGLSEAEVHRALGVDHLKDWHRGPKETMAIIDAWIAEQTKGQPEPADPLFADTPMPVEEPANA